MPARTSVAPWQTISFNSLGAPAHGSHATSRVFSAGSARRGRPRHWTSSARWPRLSDAARQTIRLMPESEKPVVRSRAAHQRPSCHSPARRCVRQPCRSDASGSSRTILKPPEALGASHAGAITLTIGGDPPTKGSVRRIFLAAETTVGSDGRNSRAHCGRRRRAPARGDDTRQIAPQHFMLDA